MKGDGDYMKVVSPLEGAAIGAIAGGILGITCSLIPIPFFENLPLTNGNPLEVAFWMELGILIGILSGVTFAFVFFRESDNNQTPKDGGDTFTATVHDDG